ncbi:phosphohistidine phosphatase SixA [Cyanobium gracile UHCC 0139]|uniref:Phosphohistidine phosphatase SixA n=1 Tax=Cyanobium gracile UHCC 0139 TaxID=3110308 RepID=A0ABU5RPN6_9CYAN|nr:phosphohistidine phosphatase SixA [Cyanobium gracile]MEA5389680.1 phosphohistidine phosphatase SixA [Cyanobium gracile UHCC 0139]
MASPAWELLLLRHGIAEERHPDRVDAERELTTAGRTRTRAVLERAASLGLRADRLLSSPLARARQTAEIACEAGLAGALELAQALEPGGDPLPLLPAWLSQAEGGAAAPCRLLLVGHEPDLGLLAARLLGAPPGAIAVRKAGLALLRLPVVPAGGVLAGTARLDWLVRPKLWLPRP